MNQRRSKAARRLVNESARMVAEADLIAGMRAPAIVRLAWWVGIRCPYRRWTARYMARMDGVLKAATKKTSHVVARSR